MQGIKAIDNTETIGCSGVIDFITITDSSQYLLCMIIRKTQQYLYPVFELKVFFCNKTKTALAYIFQVKRLLGKAMLHFTVNHQNLYITAFG